MRAAGVTIFPAFSAHFEGVVPWMYQDILRLVTIGIGNLIDPMPLALSLPFVWPGGRAATREEIASQWQAIKNDPKAAKLGHLYAERLTKIRLTPQGIATLVDHKRRQNEAVLVQRCPGFETWPVDAQLALSSWAWACGPHGAWPKFFSALRARDFATAAVEGHINDAGPDRIPCNADDNYGLKPRNAANAEMFRNAARVEASAGALDPEVLVYQLGA